MRIIEIVSKIMYTYREEVHIFNQLHPEHHQVYSHEKYIVSNFYSIISQKRLADEVNKKCSLRDTFGPYLFFSFFAR